MGDMRPMRTQTDSQIKSPQMKGPSSLAVAHRKCIR